ncbi:hypothetical protein [Uliginosibacterium sp. TH139]|uniref:hypothetical protein n=1 Tax=Uliginosibacterium sp. TH139 TaxID=2067453 RepID=UPI000C7A9745|nr:hypothetical protein [Uliginosibacterium sp. TH139]PLK49849.1 hypothetical protein C0V76_05370 [Uliginosibacterium sp. TH139]
MKRSLSILPSVELQTSEFIAAACAAGTHEPYQAELEFDDFRVALIFQVISPAPSHGIDSPQDGLTITDVFVPVQYRRRGWLVAYLRLCAGLVNGPIFIVGMHGPVRDALLRHGFRVLTDDVLVLGL